MTGERRLNFNRLAEGAGWVAIGYVLASLLLVVWVFAVLLFDSWAVWLLIPIVILVVTAIHWRVARTAGLIRVAVALPLGALGVIALTGSDSTAVMYATGAAYVLAVSFLPNLAVTRYEQRRSRAAPSH
jgi:hypothetical protein